MNYPFDIEQFLGVFNQYNNAIWPAQILFVALAIAVIALICCKFKYSSKIISVIMGLLWLWMGIVYHWTFFLAINPAAKIFTIGFVLQGLLFIYFGLFKDKLTFRFNRDLPSYLGMGMIVVSLLIYPIIGYIAGHQFPNNPTFGVPCPTTIFTLGVLLLSVKPLKRLAIIPIVWSAIGFMAAISFGIYEDSLLLLSGIIALIVIFFVKSKK